MPSHDEPSISPAAGPKPAGSAMQFTAVLGKNLLQLRGRRRVLGLAGWPALVLEICVPALFFLVACIPKYYVKPLPSPLQLSPLYDLDSPAWGTEYEGPAAGRPAALVLYTPNTSEVTSLMLLVAQAAACPADSTKKRPSGSSFFRYFPVPDAPPECMNAAYCWQHEDCYVPVVGVQLVGRASAEEAVQEAVAHPETIDAVVDWSAWQPSGAAAADGAARDLLDRSSTGGSRQGSSQLSSGEEQQLQQQHGEEAGSGGGPVFRYTIRMNHTELPFTRMILNDFDLTPGNQYKQQWFFANLQTLIDHAILAQAAKDAACRSSSSNNSCGGPGNAGAAQRLPLLPSFKPFPWPAVTIDLGATAAALFFVLLMTYAFLTPTRAAVGAVVQEKELLLREGMRILGLQDGAYWASWALTHWAAMAASGLLCALVGLYPFQHSSLLFMLAFYWLLAAALLGFAYCVSTFFASARVAGSAAAVVYALAMMPGWLMPALQPYGGAGWAAACLLPPSAISLFAHVLVRQESAARGLNWASVWQPVTVEGSFSAATVYNMLALDVLLYALLLAYLDKVMPSQSAQTWPPHFPFLPSYWRRMLGARGAGDAEAVEPLTTSAGHQPSSPNQPAVDIWRLTKVFPTTGGNEKVAVDALTLGIPQGEITGLLGHNGAGKTTTIGIITGLLSPTSGDVLVMGLSVRRDMQRIRASLGVCPQFDVLWPDITVSEHLELAAALKGYPKRERAAVALAAAEEVGLSEKLDASAGQLSGGQRRKLSVALAFVGNPAVVILDEPTSGMDPYTRRFTWDVIRRRRGRSAILLTTHSMEEADMLSDRIAIMVEGRLAAAGTSLELKSRFGVGYTLTIARSSSASQGGRGPATAAASRAASSASLLPTAAAGGDGEGGRPDGPRTPVNSPAVSTAALARAVQPQGSEAAADANIALLLGVVREHVPLAQLVSASAGEVAIRLPKEAAAAFPALLRQLESHQQELGAGSYGMSVTTLEEVFLRVSGGALTAEQLEGGSRATSGREPGPAHPTGGAESQQPQGQASGAARREEDDCVVVVSIPSSCYLRGAALWWQQFRALFAKRALCAARDTTAALVQVAVPVLLVLVALWGGRAGARFPQQPALELSRARELVGRAALLAASPGVRENSSAALAAFTAAYPVSDLHDTGVTGILKIPYLQPLLVDDYLLENWNENRQRAYDALYLDSLPDLGALGNSSRSLRYSVLANQTAVHGLPASLNQMHSALLRWITSDASAAIVATNHPLPVVYGEAEQRASQASSTLLLVLYVTMACAVLAASFAVFLVRERDSKSKAVQVIAGASPSAFWASTLAWDMLHYSVPAAGMLLCFPLFHLPQFQGIRVAAVAVLLWTFGPAALVQTYLLQWPFMDEMKALQRISTLYFCTGFLGFLSTWILDMIFSFMHTASVHRTNLIIKRALQLLSPHFCLSRGLYEIMETYKADKGQPDGNPFAWNALGSFLASLVGQVVVFGALTLVVEAGVLRRWFHRAKQAAAARGWRGSELVERRSADGTNGREPLLPAVSSEGDGSPEASSSGPRHSAADGWGEQEDADVEEERRAVQSGAVGPHNAAALLAGVSKTYWQSSSGQPVRAVRGLWLGMGSSLVAQQGHVAGECFGLLGVNGAGKTTSFSMLTGEVLPDEGEAYVAGHSLLDEPLSAHRSTGYCPQFSALPPYMTGREVLRMYARLRGLPRRLLEVEVKKLLKQMALAELADRVCGSYSGGNKRKLSVAVAIIARDTGVVCLDEPSTGVDVGARRALWEVIQSEQRSQKTVVLTSHSMEECEAVCSRVGIMAAGRLRCLGTVQHLKSRLGEGYVLHMRSEGSQVAQAETLVRELCPGMQLQERDAVGHATFAIPRQGLNLPALFEALERGRQQGHVEEYSLSQATLEQVFLALNRQDLAPSPA